MYSRKGVGPRMEPWVTPTLIGSSFEDSIQNHSKPSITEKRRNRAKYLTWNSTRLKFVKKTSLPNPVECLGYIKCRSSSGPRTIKHPSNSIRYNYKSICSWSRRPETILEIRKRPHFSRWSTTLLFTSFSKALLATERKLTGL